jgi:DNA-binding transcriptional MerR regulator
MARRYTVDEAGLLLGVHASTLRRWCRSLGIVPLIDPSHQSRRVYTEEQVLRLAEAHHRVAVLSALSSTKLLELERCVTELEQRIKALEAAMLSTGGSYDDEMKKMRSR